MRIMNRREVLRKSAIGAVAIAFTGNWATAAAEAKKDGWWIKIHTDKTEASSIRLRIGLGGKDKTHRDWMTWNSNDPTEIDLPDDIRQVKEIWIQGESLPKDRNSYVCVHFRDRTKQRMEFDDKEEHEVSQDDDDKC